MKMNDSAVQKQTGCSGNGVILRIYGTTNNYSRQELGNRKTPADVEGSVFWHGSYPKPLNEEEAATSKTGPS